MLGVEIANQPLVGRFPAYLALAAQTEWMLVGREVIRSDIGLGGKVGSPS